MILFHNFQQVVKNNLDEFGPRTVIRALRIYEEKESYAGVAFGELFGLSPADLCKIDPSYMEKRDIYRSKIDEKKMEIERVADKVTYIDCLKLKDGSYNIYLIDDSTKLMFALKKLEDAEQVAFDIEAGYVCQSIDSRPKYVYLLVSQ